MSHEFTNVGNFKTDEGQFSYYALSSDILKTKLFTVEKSPDGYVVRNAFVSPHFSRQGVATDFYTQMNRESIQKTGRPLRSIRSQKIMGQTHIALSWEGQRMWDGFVAKGLAKKLGDKDYIFLENKMENLRNKTILTREQFINEARVIKKDSLLMIHYWYNLMPTPVKVIGVKGNKILVSHNNELSKIKNAPDEEIVYSEIIKKLK